MKRGITIISVLFIVDFLLKLYVQYFIPVGVSVIIFREAVFFTHIDSSVVPTVNQLLYSLIMFSNLVLLIILMNMFTTIDFLSKRLYSSAVVIYFAGIIGGLTDRFFSSYASDYIHIRMFNVTLPVFNLSTIYVIIGVILFSIDLIMDSRRTHEIVNSKYYISKKIRRSKKDINRLTSRRYVK